MDYSTIILWFNAVAAPLANEIGGRNANGRGCFPQSGTSRSGPDQRFRDSTPKKAADEIRAIARLPAFAQKLWRAGRNQRLVLLAFYPGRRAPGVALAPGCYRPPFQGFQFAAVQTGRLSTGTRAGTALELAGGTPAVPVLRA
jgi:hypothetical protein